MVLRSFLLPQCLIGMHYCWTCVCARACVRVFLRARSFMREYQCMQAYSLCLYHVGKVPRPLFRVALAAMFDLHAQTHTRHAKQVCCSHNTMCVMYVRAHVCPIGMTACYYHMFTYLHACMHTYTHTCIYEYVHTLHASWIMLR